MRNSTIGLSSLLALAAFLTIGCSTDASDTSETGQPAAPTGDTQEPYVPDDPCGEVTFHDLSFMGVVLGVGGQPQSGARVELQDFTFQPPTVLGGADSAGGGTFTFPVTNLKSIEDCWGNGRLDYRMVATLDTARDEERINQPIFNAIFVDEDNAVDLSMPPLRLQE